MPPRLRRHFTRHCFITLRLRCYALRYDAAARYASYYYYLRGALRARCAFTTLMLMLISKDIYDNSCRHALLRCVAVLCVDMLLRHDIAVTMPPLAMPLMLLSLLCCHADISYYALIIFADVDELLSRRFTIACLPRRFRLHAFAGHIATIMSAIVRVAAIFTPCCRCRRSFTLLMRLADVMMLRCRRCRALRRLPMLISASHDMPCATRADASDSAALQRAHDIARRRAIRGKAMMSCCCQAAYSTLRKDARERLRRRCYAAAVYDFRLRHTPRHHAVTL